ncbi:type II toxin-antitoxin system PemK/MazF family toxin [Paraclostridium sordellii]|uniref:type II toxin-antitoxin system PemK/MazF family toxin n=1 Tax=Paraclostridium sordellii TaxID=1505 RepID=UPI0030CFB69C
MQDNLILLNDLSEEETREVKSTICNFESSITKNRHRDSVRYCNWLEKKVDLNLKAKQQLSEKRQNPKRYHPIRPKRGDVYLAELGLNIGSEINEQHLVLIMQNDKGNLYGDTVVVIPISSSPKLYVTHEKITQRDIKSGRLDKLPSKAKTEQIQYMDKSKLIHKVGTLENDCLKRISTRLKKNLDIE